MRDVMSDNEYDIEGMITKISAPPAAPMVIVRQKLEREKDATQPGFFLRLLGAISPKAGQ